MTTAWEINVTGRQYREAVEQDRGTEPPYSDGRSNPSPTKPHKRVAVMQPYFFPYAGYFRLFCAVDEFVIFDCVQFPRRGRVHRTRVPGPGGPVEWLTLPLAHQSRDVLIRDLAFSSDARVRFDERLVRLPWILSAVGPTADRIREFLFSPLECVVDYLEASLRIVTDVLGIYARISRSSGLNLNPLLRGQARVIAAAKSVGATHYVNSPGARALYDADTFTRAGIELSFLSPYAGRFFHLLPALMMENSEEMRLDVYETSTLNAPYGDDKEAQSDPR